MRRLFLREDLEKRKDMPQVRGSDTGEVLMSLVYGGIEPHLCTVSVLDLQPKQKEVIADKVNSIVKDLASGKKMPEIIISKDNVILDGHHRWEAFKKAGKMSINAMRVPLNADEALDKVRKALEAKPVVDKLDKETQMEALTVLRGVHTEAQLRSFGYTKAAICEAYNRRMINYNAKTGSYSPIVWSHRSDLAKVAKKVIESLLDSPEEEENMAIVNKKKPDQLLVPLPQPGEDGKKQFLPTDLEGKPVPGQQPVPETQLGPDPQEIQIKPKKDPKSII